MNKKLLPLLIFAMLFIVACSNDTKEEVIDDGAVEESANSENTEDFPVTVTNNDKDITIEKKPEKIIPMSLETAEIVLSLTDASDVIATTRGIDNPLLSTKHEEGQEIEHRIGAATNIDPEEIIAHETDLLIMTKMYGQEEDAEDILAQFDTPILSFDPFVTVEGFQEAFKIVGEAIGEKKKATSIVDDMNESIKNIQADIPEDESPTVLVLSEVGGDMGPFMLGPTNISYDLVKLAGATPAADVIDMERSAPAEIEQILKVDPDYIILLDFFGKGEASFENLMKDPAWNTLQAVQDDKVLLDEAKNILNPNVDNVKGLQTIVDFIYE